MPARPGSFLALPAAALALALGLTACGSSGSGGSGPGALAAPAPTSAAPVTTPSTTTTPTPAPARSRRARLRQQARRRQNRRMWGCRSGDKGPQVTALQKRLVQLGFWLSAADGSYGDTTEQAVLAFQKAAGLERDGVAGPQTMKALTGRCHGLAA